MRAARTKPTAGRAAARSGWVVLGGAVATAALTGPGQTIGVSVFIDHFVADLSLARSEVSTAYLLGTLTGAMMLPTVGRLVDHFGVRVAQATIGVLFALALVNMSMVDGLVWLAIGFAGIRFLGQGALSMVSTLTVQLRFDRARGTALGMFTTASAGAMALVPVVLSLVIARWGWRAAWLVSAGAVLVVVVPVAWLVLGGLPSRRSAVDRDAVPAGHDRRAATRTPSFWLLASVTGAAGMMSTALNFHQIDLLGDAGLSETAAAALFVPQVVGSSVAGLTIGYVGDRVGTRYLPAASMALLFAAQVLGALAAPGVVVIAYAIVLGAAGGAVRTASSTLQPQWFGIGHLGSIQGALTLFGVAASALGPVVLTLSEQAVGSYPPALLLLSVVPLAAFVFALGPNRGPTSPVAEPAAGPTPDVPVPS